MKALITIDSETVRRLSEGLSEADFKRIVADTDLSQIIPPWAMSIPGGVVRRELDEALKYNWMREEEKSGAHVHISYCKYGLLADAAQHTRKKVKRVTAKRLRRIFKRSAKRG